MLFDDAIDAILSHMSIPEEDEGNIYLDHYQHDHSTKAMMSFKVDFDTSTKGQLGLLVTIRNSKAQPRTSEMVRIVEKLMSKAMQQDGYMWKQTPTTDHDLHYLVKRKPSFTRTGESFITRFCETLPHSSTLYDVSYKQKTNWSGSGPRRGVYVSVHKKTVFTKALLQKALATPHGKDFMKAMITLAENDHDDITRDNWIPGFGAESVM